MDPRRGTTTYSQQSARGKKTKGFCFQVCPLCAPSICAGLLLIAPFRSLVAFVVPMELRFFHGDTFDPWRYVFIHRRRQTCSWCYARHSYARDFPIRDWSVAVSAFTTLALAVFSLFHGFCFVPWVLPCYRPEKERFSSQELSFPIISALRVFEKKCAGLLLIAPFRSLAAGNNFSHRISSQEFSIRNDFGPFATI